MSRNQMAKKDVLSSYLSDLGRKGGKATAKKLTAEERSASARRAAKARWAKARKDSKKTE